jgi:hypothetical protein
MALTSPGVEVTVIDESQYIPSAVNTVPYFLIATAQNKISGTGIGVAAGTTAANANKTYLITSQRDLASTFGVPFFYSTTNGTPINGYELNEYGLLAAYSSLGVSNRAYVQRVNVDLSELTATLIRPTGEPANGTFWLDTSTSLWGIQEWNRTTGSFTPITPLVITDPALVTDAENNDLQPLITVGSIGQYAVVALGSADGNNKIQGWYKNIFNNWVIVGSKPWQQSWPTITGTAAPVTLTNGQNIIINDSYVVTVGDNGTDATVSGFATAINDAAIPGISAAVSGGRLVIYADSDATNDGSTAGAGIVSIEDGPNSGAALLTALGIEAKEYVAPIFFTAYSFQVPRWRTTDFQGGRPTGSVWANASPVNNGTDIKIKRYDANIGEWISQNANLYSGTAAATYALDPANGGSAIPVGTTFTQYSANFSDYTPNDVYSLEVYEKIAIGDTVVTGGTTLTGNAFTLPASFLLNATQPGISTTPGALVTLTGQTVSDFIAAVSAANVPNVSASVNSAGNIVFTHRAGGTIFLRPTVGDPITTAGFIAGATPNVEPSSIIAGSLVLSNWASVPAFTYTASNTAPDTDPVDSRLWYYSTVDQADIMVQNNGQWFGYQQVTNDVRGFDLSLTNPSGPIIASTAPTTQNNAAQSPLQYGDLWIDSSDLENYPVIYRWEPANGVDQWVAVNTTDQVTQNGILFADARWAPNGTTDPISDPIPSIESLLTSDYLDLDAPNPVLYPQGMLLWNTRRSGYNVKSFQSNYFNATDFPDDVLPSEKNAWVTASGNKADGSMYSGRLAQRQMIIKAMKSGIDTNRGAREETSQYTLIAAPGYPELIPNMVALSNERNNTLFVVGDTPMRLEGNGNDLVTWATNNNGLGLTTGDGLTTTSNYMATFYPSCTTTDLSGQTVVAPPSHMMMRTIIRSDEVSYPWLAPAGTRRGVVDNAIQLGYIDGATGEFTPLSVNQALRDILYERNINPITFIPGVGITNFGNKTSTTVTTALDRINVARLVAFLRGRLEEIGKLYLFEPNDTITRNEITNTVNSLMVDLVAKRAIYDYLVVCDLSNNTPARIDRNELWVDIAIEPVKAVEFIYIPLRIKNTGDIAAGL